MAIIKCPECGNDVSDKAKTCPHCGVDIFGNIHHCPRCYNVFLADVNVCPDCGSVVRKSQSAVKNENASSEKRSTNAKPKNKEKKSSVFLRLTIAFVVAVLLVLAGIYCYMESKNAAESEAYKSAMESGAPVALHNYLERFGDENQSHRDSVMAVLEYYAKIDSAWYEACKKSSREAYVAFLDTYPENEYVLDVKLRIDSIDWHNATASNTAEAYKFYLDNNPSGIHVDEAEAEYERLDAKSISKADSTMVIKLFESYYKALETKDDVKIKELFSLPINSFLSKPRSTTADVKAYMQRLYSPKDIKGISFVLPKDWNIEKSRDEKGNPFFIVKFDVDYKFDRTNKTKKTYYSYKVKATVSRFGRISSLDMELASD